MKILKLLNSIYFSILLGIILIGFNAKADDEPIDIWNIDQKKIEETKSNINQNSLETSDAKTPQTSIFNLQSEKEIEGVQVSSSLESQEIKIIGLYDPEDYDLKIDLWSNTNGDQLKKLFSNLAKIELSKDASELMNIVLLTNSYNPKINITEKEFLNFKSNWLIKNKDRKLIEEYLIKNQVLNLHPNLSRYLVDQYLSEANIEKACELFLENTKVINDDYLSKFNLYCLINADRVEEAQLILDLKKELGFEDEYFENKINYLFGYTKEPELTISESSVLDFHLAHRSNPDFVFEPKKSTDPQIWKYLSASNLLFTIEEIDILEEDKISLLEQATHDKNYSEEDLFEFYKKFQFNINQLINVKEAHNSLSSIEGRALLYQRILLTEEPKLKLEFIKTLKDSFIIENIGDAFDLQLTKFLKQINFSDVPSNYTTFYKRYLNDELDKSEIKYNSKILHQSKLINYFYGDYERSKIERDLDEFLLKIQRNEDYSLSKKDIIFLEALRSDGINISDKFNDLYEIKQSNIPLDIQKMIDNNEIGSVLLRIIKEIGSKRIENIDEDTVYLIISTLNKLNVDVIRNKLLLKVLPLKV